MVAKVTYRRRLSLLFLQEILKSRCSLYELPRVHRTRCESIRKRKNSKRMTLFAQFLLKVELIYDMTVCRAYGKPTT